MIAEGNVVAHRVVFRGIGEGRSASMVEFVPVSGGRVTGLWNLMASL